MVKSWTTPALKIPPHHLSSTGKILSIGYCRPSWPTPIRMTDILLNRFILSFSPFCPSPPKNPKTVYFLEDPSDPGPLKLALSQNQIIFVENLRFWPDETAGSFPFLQPLIDQSQAFVNDAIAAYHPAASITLHHVLPGYYGLSFLEELQNLAKLATCPHPLTVILGGAKMDKLDYLPALINLSDHILIGGKLPTQKSSTPESDKIYWASLTPDSFDIDAASIAHFTQILNSSATIIWSGALGFYENPAFRTGTIEIARAIALSPAVFKVIAGGDTSASVKDLGMLDKINFICNGGESCLNI